MLGPLIGPLLFLITVTAFVRWVTWPKLLKDGIYAGACKLRRYPSAHQGMNPSLCIAPKGEVPNTDWAIWALIRLNQELQEHGQWGRDGWYGATESRILANFSGEENTSMQASIKNGLGTLVRDGLIWRYKPWRKNQSHWIYLPTNKFFEELADYEERNGERY